MTNYVRMAVVVALVALVLFSLFESVEGKKKSLFKERGPKREREVPIDDEEADAEPLDGIELGEDGEEDTITFKSDADKERKMKKLKELRRNDKDQELSDEEMKKLRSEAVELRKNVLRAALNHGEMSREKATAMHALGRNIFKQKQYSLIYALSWDILKIHEELDGNDSDAYAKALTNVGSTAWKLGEGDVARITMLRQLGIHREHGLDEGGKEIMTTRARLMSYQHKDQKPGEGYSHHEFLEAIAPFDLTGQSDEL